MRYDADHKARTRKRVLQEAVRAIRTDGPSRIGLAGVMSCAAVLSRLGVAEDVQ